MLVKCAAIVSTFPFVTASKWMNVDVSPEDRAAALISEMTLPEKLVMLSGKPNDLDGDVIYVGFVPGNERLGIPELRLNDG
jgi:hypothetical protein